MYQNLKNMNQYKTLFDDNFTLGQIYSRQEIADLFQKHRMNNPTAFTYNRWNIGQTSTNCYFEYLGKAKYKYLGPDFKFTGPCYHHPQNNCYYKIGEWLDGVFTFADPNVFDFLSWREKYRKNDLALDFYQTVLENCPFELENLSLSTTEKRIICQSQNKHVEEFIVMKPESALAKMIINQSIENEFEFGPNKFRISKIYPKVKVIGK